MKRFKIGDKVTKIKQHTKRMPAGIAVKVISIGRYTFSAVDALGAVCVFWIDDFKLVSKENV